ncbi:MAG TPA: hypothetical protein VF062_15420 [Candidatus Limnocylindrales bacterium]
MTLALIHHDDRSGVTTVYRMPATATIRPLNVADEFGRREVQVTSPDNRDFRDSSLGAALVELLDLRHPMLHPPTGSDLYQREPEPDAGPARPGVRHGGVVDDAGHVEYDPPGGEAR